MDINEMDQGLLIRNPSMTPEQFSHHWLHKHAPLVVPFFLHLGLQHYQQIHAPFTSSTTKSATASLPAFDGVVGLPPQSALDNPPQLEKWVQAYYEEVILVDERRFLVSPALEHLVRVENGEGKGGRIEGRVEVVIGEGRCKVEVPETVMEVWRGFEERGRKEAEGMGEKKAAEKEV